MEVERVWVQKAGSCIVDWLFCKKGQEKQVSETCSNKKNKKKKRKKKDVRGIHGSSDHGEGSHLGNRSCASRYLYSVSTGKSLKSIYMGTSVFIRQNKRQQQRQEKKYVEQFLSPSLGQHYSPLS